MHHLLARPEYFPPQNGRYEVSAGLQALGVDFGNGVHDKHVFQVDEDYFEMIKTKHLSRSESLKKYYPNPSRLKETDLQSVCSFIAATLSEEHPKYFSFENDGFKNHLTGESFSIGGHYPISSTASPVPYRDVFDAMACQVQSDLAIWKRSENKEWLSAIHLSFPNHWSPEEKIGKSFNEVHLPVSGFERLSKASAHLVDQMVAKGPYVRFAWGVSTDRRLNHHPHPKKGCDKGEWIGRRFNEKRPSLFLRVERQTLSPFTDLDLSLFTIKTTFEDVLKMDQTKKNLLACAIEFMSEEALVYKGLKQDKSALLSFLKGSL